MRATETEITKETYATPSYRLSTDNRHRAFSVAGLFDLPVDRDIFRQHLKTFLIASYEMKWILLMHVATKLCTLHIYFDIDTDNW